MVHCFVDDLLVMAKSENTINELKLNLVSKLPANDMRRAADYFGMKILQTSHLIGLCHKKYVDIFVSKMGLRECSASRVPCDKSDDFSTKGKVSSDDSFLCSKLIGSLLYIVTHTRLNIALVTSMLAWLDENTSIKHQEAAMKVVKHLVEQVHIP